jgi:hypothetical protein
VGVVLTGRRENRRFTVKVAGVAIGLSRSLFGAFCKLVATRLAHARAPSLPKMTVRRLRHALDEATKRTGFGELLIHPVPKGKYWLTIEPDQIAMDASLRDLIDEEVIDPAIAEILLRHAGC